MYQANPGNVSTTIVNGDIVMEQREIKNIDMDEMQQAVRTIEADIAEFAKELSKKAIKSKSLMQ